MYSSLRKELLSTVSSLALAWKDAASSTLKADLIVLPEKKAALPGAYGNIGHINHHIANALLDYVTIDYLLDAVGVQYGPISKEPFKGYQGIQFTYGNDMLEAIMRKRVNLFLSVVSLDDDAIDRDIHVSRQGEDSIIVYNDPADMISYLKDLYDVNGITCDFTRQYDDVTRALTPRTKDHGFYMN